MSKRLLVSAGHNLSVIGPDDFLTQYVDNNLLLGNILPDFSLVESSGDRSEIKFHYSNENSFEGTKIGILKNDFPNIGQVSYLFFHAFQRKFLLGGSYSLEGASVFSPSNQGILLVGPSGSGKSSVALQLMLNEGWRIGGDESVLVKCSYDGIKFLGGNTISAVNDKHLERLIGSQDLSLDFVSHPSKAHKKYLRLPISNPEIDIRRIVYLGISEVPQIREYDENHSINCLFRTFSEHIGNAYTWLKTSVLLEDIDTRSARKQRLEDVICMVSSGNVKVLEIRGPVNYLPQMIKEIS